MGAINLGLKAIRNWWGRPFERLTLDCGSGRKTEELPDWTGWTKETYQLSAVYASALDRWIANYIRRAIREN